MAGAGAVHIERLGSDHDRGSFDCGVEALDRYIRMQAGQDSRRSVARVFVAIGSDPRVIRGFYTLSAAAIGTVSLPQDTARRLPRYPVPAALIGRLAVDRRFSGQGLGRVLLADAIKRATIASENIAIHLVVVDAKDEAARAFYEHFGFRLLTDDARRLFLPLARSSADT